MLKSILTITLFLGLSFSSFAETKCEGILNNNYFKIYSTYLNEISKQAPVWAQFNISDHLFLATSPDNQNCVVAFLEGEQRGTFKLKKNLGISSWSFVELDGYQYPPLEDDLKGIISDFGHREALIISVDKHISYNIELTAHEGFHGFYQQEDKMPQWWSHVDREKLSKNCYHDLGESYKDEAKVLISAYELIQAGHTDIAKELVRSFISGRKKRYNLLSNIVVTDGSYTYTCEEAEANMELLEGHAQFVGEETTIKLGLSNSYVMAAEYVKGLDDSEVGWFEPFYYFGSLQLHIIKKIMNDSFSQWSDELYQSETPVSLYKVLEKLVEK